MDAGVGDQTADLTPWPLRKNRERKEDNVMEKKREKTDVQEEWTVRRTLRQDGERSNGPRLRLHVFLFLTFSKIVCS